MKLSFRLVFLACLSLTTVVGCGSSSDKPEPMASDQQVQNMVKARDLFDASSKDWNSLPADKKAEYTKLVNAKDEAGAKKWWDTMSHPIGAGPGPTRGPQ